MWFSKSSQRPSGGTALFLTLTAVSLSVYVYTLCPTVYAGDSGELSLACLSLGVPHPPGYPLFVLLGRLFCATGRAEPAYLTNLMCALAASLAAGLLGVLIKRLTGRTTAAAAGALLFAFSSVIWSQAVITEVYSLLSLSFISFLVAVERVARGGRSQHYYLLVYLSALGCVVHQSLVLCLPATGWLLISRRRSFRMSTAAGLFALGLSPFLLLLIRSAANPLIDWGNPETVPALFGLLFRRNYGPLRQNPLSIGLVLGNVQAFFTLLLAVYPVWLAALAPLGLAGLKRRRPAFNRLLIGLFFPYLFGFILLVNPYPDRVHLYQMTYLYFPLYVVFGVWIGAGLDYLAEAAAGLFQVEGPPGVVRAVRVGVGALMLAAPVWLLAVNFKHNNLRDFFDARVYGENILRGLPPGAVLVVDGDNETFITGYLQLALGVRPDVTLVHRKGYLFQAPDYLTGSSRRDLERNSERRLREILENRPDVYFATYNELPPAAGRRLEREGILFRAVPVVGTSSATESGGFARTARAEATRSARSRARLVAGDFDILKRESGRLDFIVRKFAIGYLQSLWEDETTGRSPGGLRGYQEKGALPEQREQLLSAIGIMGYDFAEARYMIGFERERQGRYRQAYDEYLAAARLDPRAPFPRRGLERLAGVIAAAPDSLTGL